MVGSGVWRAHALYVKLTMPLCAGKLNFELQVRETTRDVTFLHNQTMLAAAQKQHVFVYDDEGTELHCLRWVIGVRMCVCVQADRGMAMGAGTTKKSTGSTFCRSTTSLYRSATLGISSTRIRRRDS